MLRLHRIVIATCLSLGVGASALVTPVDAAGASTTLRSKYTVVNGDYLAGIALKLNVRLKDLLASNQLTVSSLILPGMQLVVPATAGATTPARSSAQATTGTAGASKAAVYIVRNGDYLTGIAGTLKVSTRDLLKANKLSLNSLIWPGMPLKVPVGGVLPSAPTGTAPAPSSSKTSSAATYTVVNGDYLAGIAQKLGVKLASLLTVNQMTTSSLIYPGLQLKVPAGATMPTTSTGNGSSAASNSPTLSGDVARVIAFARAQLGKPYKFNTAGPATFDCSGLTLAAFDTIGVTLPHYSGAQMSFGTVVDWTTEAIRPGDLIFLESAPGTGVVNHVGIATSATTWIQAPRSGDVVREGKISTLRIIGVRRLVNG
jgi:cell wall-associated NlpC family hydrolase